MIKLITKVSLMNWRSHSKSEVEFVKGTNALIGKMGSGKSSIMNAICFGLFGTFPDLQTRKLKLDDLIMDKPTTETESHVVVSFAIGDKEYTVTRIIERGKGTVYSEIREGENLIESPNTQRVTEIVQDKLKVDYDSFSRVIYSEQNALDYFLRLPRGERMKRIDNLLMIDRFEKARTNAVTLHNKILDRKNEKENMIGQFSINEIKENLSDVNYSIEKLNTTLNKLSNELQKKSKSKILVEKELKDLENKQEKLNILLQDKKLVDGALEENQKAVTKFKETIKNFDIKNGQKELERIENKIKTLKNKTDNLRTEFNKASSDYSSLETKTSFLLDEINKLRDDISEKEKFIKEISELEKSLTSDPEEYLTKKREQISSLIELESEKLTRKKQTEKNLSEISRLKGKCPTCQSQISKEKKNSLIDSYNERISSLEKEIKKLKNQKLEEEKTFEEIKNKIQRWNLLREKTSDITNKKNKLHEKSKLLDADKKTFEKLKNKITELSDLLKKKEPQSEELVSEKNKIVLVLQKNDELEYREKRIVELNKKSNLLGKEIASFSKKIKTEKLKEIKKEFQALVSRESELSTRVESLRELMAEKEKRKLEFEQKLSIVEKEKNEIKNLELIIRELKKFEKALKKTQVHLREKFIESVNETMNQIWPDIYPYEDFIGSRLHIKDRDYVLQLETRSGRWVDVEGVASGGERSISCLVLRVAFSIVLAPQLRMLVLDEPTANLDTRAIEDLATTLRDKVGDFLNQVFIVTHEKRLEDAVTGYMYSFMRNKEIDEPTRIEMVN